jgi:ParB/RepB/Spo0J family partition protein
MPKAAAVQTSTIPTLQLIALSKVTGSAGNPRKNFDETALAELAADIKLRGVLQPVLVRPVKGPTLDVEYELVFGERRFRAAKLAGLVDLPAMVRELTDVEVLETQLTENLKRADLHPLEEADGYQRLHDVHALKVEEIAERVGKSREYVYARMKLTALQGAGRKAFSEGRINASVAVVLARIPVADLQEKAAKEVLDYDAEYDASTGKVTSVAMSAREAAEHVQENYMLRLAEAPFDRKDEQLVAGCGACGDCPHNTASQKDLFSDVKGAALCTNPPCFASKKKAAFQKEKAEAAEKGQELLSAGESKKLFDSYSGELKPSAEYVELRTEVGKKSLKDLVGKDVSVVLARDGKGKVHQLVERAAANQALKSAGVKAKLEKKAAPRGYDYAAEQEKYKKQREKQEAEEAVRKVAVVKALAAIVADVEKKDSPVKSFLLGIASRIDVPRTTIDRRGWKSGKDIEKALWKMGEPELRGFLFECVVANRAEVYGGYDKDFVATCKAFKVDLGKLEAEEVKASTPAAEAKGGPAAPAKGVCRECKCTNSTSCKGGCAWVDDSETLCTACVELEPEDRPHEKAATKAATKAKRAARKAEKKPAKPAKKAKK